MIPETSLPPSPSSWRPRVTVLLSMIGLAALARLLPHPPNFTLIGGMAFFGGACLADRRLAFLLPLAALFLSDLFLGLHVLIPVVLGDAVSAAGMFSALALAERGFPVLREQAVVPT